jgi:two-component system chemotaxis response regulator CheB
VTAAVETLAAHCPRFIGVGASAGGVEAVGQLLRELPAAFRAPIAVVVHVPADRDSALPAMFARRCALRVEEAEDKVIAVPGTVYFAPPDYHVLVERDGRLALSNEAPVHYSRPSIDVLFESVAHAFGARALGILLSGANADGAEGLARIRSLGGITWVQAPASARVPTMPEAALALAAHPVLDPAQMGRALAAWAAA